MEPMTLNVDARNSKITIRTRASGMLARLAHDLEIAATDFRGLATRDDNGFSGEISVAIAGLRVTGQLHGDRVDSAGISNSDRHEIERKIREEVFSGAREITIRGRGAAWTNAEITVEAPHGKMPVSASIQGTETDGDIRVTGRTELSLSRLGVKEIKGPLGAFKVKDAVEVLFEITLRPPQQ